MSEARFDAILMSAVIAAFIVPAFAGCAGGGGDDAPDTVETRTDHTVSGFADVNDFFLFAGSADPGKTPTQVKFIIRDFNGSAAVHYEEPGFYEMHDEWSWFSLLNGIEIPGYDFAPLSGYSFNSVAEIVVWAREQDRLPLDLMFVSDGDRLYSPLFYQKAFNRTDLLGNPIERFFGCGSMLHFTADDRRPINGEIWAFELEYGDVATVSDIARFFEILGDSMPDEVRLQMVWLVRSDAQKAVAMSIDADGGEMAGKWVTWEQVTIPGESETYNPGIAAGIMKIFEPGESPLVDAARTIAVLREIPDDLPPVAAIVTSVPQTPLSHIGILAKARGTPNMYVAGIADDDRTATWESYRRPVVVKATADGQIFQEMTGAEWSHYQTLLTPKQAEIDPVDVSTMPETWDPLTASPDYMDDMIPAVGGKTAGFVMLNAYHGLDIPDRPIGITVRGYNEFIAGIEPPVEEILAHSAMTDSRIALVVTEGPGAYLEANGNSDAAQEWLEAVRLGYRDTVVGQAIERGGIMQMVMTAPISAGYLDRITSTLATRFDFLSDLQGLRFRSSSSAEDIEGFSGAGLYESHTGYLHPELQPSKNKYRTVEYAMRRVWASYWLYNAYQERELAGIDHLAANMGILVHPVFDDDRESANGVLTLELVKKPDGDVVTLTANMQKGALSVTNPPPDSDALPEVDIVTRVGAAEPVIQRVRPSTEADPGELLLSDEELKSMTDIYSGMAADWLVLRNADLKSAQMRTTITIDTEIKRMAAGWPSLKNGTMNPPRLIFKQARTVEQTILAGADIKQMPVPRDILAYTTRVEKVTCATDAFNINVYLFFTDFSKPWPFDFHTTPFVAWAGLSFKQSLPGFTFSAGDSKMLTHKDTTFVLDTLEGCSIDIMPENSEAGGFLEMKLDKRGFWTITGGKDAFASGSDLVCTTAVLLSSPASFLQSLLN